MTAALTSDRRTFLKSSLAAGLVIGFNIPIAKRAAAAAPSEFVPNAFIRIAPDSTVTVISKHIEFGQGPYTGIATILADELDADWSQMRAESAPADHTRYANLAFGAQGTGGSTAMANSWEQLRKAGAEARARLIAAAAEAWGTSTDGITIEKGVIKHPSGKTATFGELASRAQSITLAAEAKPKAPADWKLIGKHVTGKIDTAPKTNGTAMFTIDVKLDNTATCLIARPSRFGAKAKSFDPAPALAIAGVKEVFVVPQGVAVLADGFWAAKKGRDALKIDWDEMETEARSSAELVKSYTELANTTGAVARNDGDAEAALKGAAKVVEATYVFPYLAHAPLEPNDCVIRRTDDGGAELLFGSQLQTVDQAVAAAVLGLKPEQVKIKTLLAGGSFGRRATPAGRHGGRGSERAQGSEAPGADQGHLDARGRHQGRTLPADLRAPRARRARRQGQYRRVGPVDRRPVVHEGLAVRSDDGQGRRRPDDGRGCQHAAVSGSEPARVGAYRRSGRHDAVVAQRRLDAHSVFDGDVPRSARGSGWRRSAGDPPKAAGQASAASRRAQSRCGEGGLGARRSRKAVRGALPCTSPSSPSWLTWSRCRSATMGCPRSSASCARSIAASRSTPT